MRRNTSQISNNVIPNMVMELKGLDNKLVPALTIGFITLFVLSALIDMPTFTSMIQTSFSSAAQMFGSSWQWLMLVNFFQIGRAHV